MIDLYIISVYIIGLAVLNGYLNSIFIRMIQKVRYYNYHVIQAIFVSYVIIYPLVVYKYLLLEKVSLRSNISLILYSFVLYRILFDITINTCRDSDIFYVGRTSYIDRAINSITKKLYNILNVLGIKVKYKDEYNYFNAVLNVLLLLVTLYFYNNGK